MNKCVAVTLLSCAVVSKILLHQPFGSEQSAGRTTDEEEFKSLLSPEQLGQLKDFQEEQRYNDLQNEKDTDEIYSYGLKGQQNPTILEQNKLYISGFKRWMNIASRMNEFYNRFKGLMTPEKMGIRDNLQDGLNNFEITKSLTLMIVYEFADLNKELEHAFKNLGYIDMTPFECVEFLGFKQYYTNILSTADQTLAEYLDLQHKLELRVYDLVRKGKLFMDALYAIRHFDRLIFTYFEDEGKNFQVEDADADIETKINSSVSIINKGLEFKNTFAEIFDGLTTGLENLNTARDDVLALLKRMDELPKAGPQPPKA